MNVNLDSFTHKWMLTNHSGDIVVKYSKTEYLTCKSHDAEHWKGARLWIRVSVLGPAA